MRTDAPVLEYLEQRHMIGVLELIFRVVPEHSDKQYWQCVVGAFERRGLSNAEYFYDGAMHRITLKVEPSNFDASTDELEASISEAGRQYLEEVIPAREAAAAQRAESEARARRESELIDQRLRRRFPGLSVADEPE
jgi:hypothetical protein